MNYAIEELLNALHGYEDESVGQYELLYSLESALEALKAEIKKEEE